MQGQDRGDPTDDSWECKGGSVYSQTPLLTGLRYFHSVGDRVRGVLQTHMFPWLHKLPVCLVSDTSKASRLQRVTEELTEEKQPPLHSSQCCPTETPASVVTSASEVTSEFHLLCTTFWFFRLCQLMKYLNQKHQERENRTLHSGFGLQPVSTEHGQQLLVG